MNRKTLVMESQLRLFVRSILNEEVRDFEPSDDPFLAAKIQDMKDRLDWDYRSSLDIKKARRWVVDDDGEIWELSGHGKEVPDGLHWNREKRQYETPNDYYERIGRPFVYKHTEWQPPAPPKVDVAELQDDGLGKYAFSPQRVKGELEVPFEPNTPVEQYLYDSLVDHLMDNKPVTPELFELIERFAKTKKYSDVFEVLDPSTPIYRGMSIPEKALAKALVKQGLEADTLSNMKKGDRVRVEGIPWGKAGSTSSWSLDREVAHDFAIENAKYSRNGYPIVVSTTIASTPRYISMGKLYRLNRRTMTYVEEREVVTYGPIKGATTEVTFPPTRERYTPDY